MKKVKFFEKLALHSFKISKIWTIYRFSQKIELEKDDNLLFFEKLDIFGHFRTAPSNYNDSLMIPFIGGEKKLNIPNKFEIKVNNLQFQSLESQNEVGGAIKIVTPKIVYNISSTYF